MNGVADFIDMLMTFKYMATAMTMAQKYLQMKVAECVDEITAWMEANCLKLKSGKTELIWFSSRQNLKSIPSYFVRVLESNLFPSKSVKIMEIFMDRNFKMSTQRSKTIQMGSTCLSQIRPIKTIDSLKNLHQP